MLTISYLKFFQKIPSPPYIRTVSNSDYCLSGFLLGSMIASVSPAVVVPCLFRLRDVGYGVSKGIPTIVVAAAAVDDSISVAIFAIILNAMFSSGSATFNIIKVKQFTKLKQSDETQRF